MADALATELVAGLNHPFISSERERSLATSLAHGVQRIENRAGGLARTVERRGVDGCNRIGLGIPGQVRGGGLSHATAKVGKMEVGQSLIEQMVGVIYLLCRTKWMVVALMSRLSASRPEGHENVVLISPIYRVSRSGHP